VGIEGKRAEMEDGIGGVAGAPITGGIPCVLSYSLWVMSPLKANTHEDLIEMQKSYNRIQKPVQK
jgi:hypothetical protein